MGLRHPERLIPFLSCKWVTNTADPTWGDIFECCFKAQSSKLERLLCHVSVKRDVWALSFELWKSFRKCDPTWDWLYKWPTFQKEGGNDTPNAIGCNTVRLIPFLTCKWVIITSDQRFKKKGLDLLHLAVCMTILYESVYVSVFIKEPPHQDYSES